MVFPLKNCGISFIQEFSDCEISFTIVIFVTAKLNRCSLKKKYLRIFQIPFVTDTREIFERQFEMSAALYLAERKSKNWATFYHEVLVTSLSSIFLLMNIMKNKSRSCCTLIFYVQLLQRKICRVWNFITVDERWPNIVGGGNSHGNILEWFTYKNYAVR